ncbi:MAG: efflux RND transporter permease subunit [Magnetococcales bacterium]|nr:efflux RND transporter permease subunit [Magnetococcales bacterium]NGZ05526.1 efflux RND transporter permease subunit [Magnetococcales bacterium]
MIRTFLGNHVLANLAFALVLLLGFMAYDQLPRQQDPDMNFNWISIVTTMPGAAAEDVERLITDPLEEALQNIPDVRFVMSSSSDATSSILVRFHELNEREFDRRITDLRREISNKQRELPPEIEDPFILEITSANGWPTVMAVVTGEADDENLRQQARHIQKDLEGIQGVDSVIPLGLRDPEIQIRFDPFQLAHYGLDPTRLANQVTTRFRDLAGGSVAMGEGNRLLRYQGTTPDPAELASWSLAGREGELPLNQVAEVLRARKKAERAVRYQGKPAILLTVTKRPGVNTLELTARIQAYLNHRDTLKEQTGVSALLADDQTPMVQNALTVMESNALMGLGLVFVTAWLFLGLRISILVSLGIPFALAGCFILLYAFGHTLNVMALLGVVIALGMLVDDAVVVVESISQHLAHKMEAMEAAISGLREVMIPVGSSSLTTMAAFLPLMLLPGILGKFMREIPMVVSLALAISLVEAFWMLPAHVAAIRWHTDRPPNRMQRWRARWMHRIRIRYVQVLIPVLRRPRLSLTLALIGVVAAIGVVASGRLKMDFFAMDPMPLFYVNIQMPAGSSLDRTMQTTLEVEKRVRANMQPHEIRSVVPYAGQMMTDTAPFFGDRFGQILISLNPDNSARRPVADIIASMRTEVLATPGPDQITFMPMSGGPPVTRPISVKVRGTDLEQLRAAVAAIRKILEQMPEVSDISDNFAMGSRELVLRPNDDALRRSGLDTSTVTRLTRLLADGEIVATFQHQGESVKVRVMAKPDHPQGVNGILNLPVALPNGTTTTLGTLTHHETRQGVDTIHHYNFRRSITVEADLDRLRKDVVTANNHLKQEWNNIRTRFPGVDLDFSGILDDIQEAMDAILMLFLFGFGLLYLILGTQFNSYFQPLLILSTVIMAFVGVVCGLLITGHPLSLYTLYGVVALSGIAVNSAIVLIDAANERRRAGMSPMHAIIFAARRRVIPILITSITTIAGLMSLAMGLLGKSLLWGPVATSIVWGLAFSTLLTLLLIPLLYLIFMNRHKTREITR